MTLWHVIMPSMIKLFWRHPNDIESANIRHFTNAIIYFLLTFWMYSHVLQNQYFSVMLSSWLIINCNILRRLSKIITSVTKNFYFKHLMKLKTIIYLLRNWCDNKKDTHTHTHTLTNSHSNLLLSKSFKTNIETKILVKCLLVTLAVIRIETTWTVGSVLPKVSFHVEYFIEFKS